MEILQPELIQISVIAAVTVTLSVVFGFIIKKVKDKVSKSATVWDDALLDAVHRPLQLLIWATGIFIILGLIENRIDWIEQSWLTIGQKVLVVILLGDFVLRLISNTESGLLTPGVTKRGKEEGYDPTTVHAVSKLLRAVVFILGALIIMQTLGYSLTGVIAFGGIGGIAIGFAARDLLANIFGALMLYMDRPFKVGDWIRSPDKNIEGTVEYIGWRLTRIRTFDQRPLYVPNATFTNISVENPSRMLNRRIKETIGVRYEDNAKLKKILPKVREYLQSNEHIAQNKTLMVNFNEFADSSLNFFIYCFTKTTVWAEYHAIKEQVLLDIMQIVEKAGAEIAFPTRTLHVEPVQVKK